MGKTYFSLSDNLNFNGKAIKIKANSTEISAKEERKGTNQFTQVLRYFRGTLVAKDRNKARNSGTRQQS